MRIDGAARTIHVRTESCDNRDMPDELTPREVAERAGRDGADRPALDRRRPAARDTGRSAGARVAFVALGRRGGRAVGARPPDRSEPLLVANRGEIAVRIARTARRMGMRVIGIHAPDDRAARRDRRGARGPWLPRRRGDPRGRGARRAPMRSIPGTGSSPRIRTSPAPWPPPASAGSGRRPRRSPRWATRPRPDGARPPTAFRRSRATTATRRTTRRWPPRRSASAIPLLVKPSAGGGGKGMRVVRDAGELAEALAGARREAHRSFGDDRLILERYLEGARHVEVQVLFDAHGRGVHLGERDCSAQRRNQKIVEEAPAPSVTPELRARMGEAALAVAAAAGYVSAGTVEMLLTDDGRVLLPRDEHAPPGRAPGHRGGHRARPRRRPARDRRRARRWPSSACERRRPRTATRSRRASTPRTPSPASCRRPGGSRSFAGPPASGSTPACAEGDEVGDRYDPMLAKVIAHGPNRGTPHSTGCVRALAETTVLGVRTNLRFLRWLLEQPVMRDGEMRTDTIAGLELPGPPVAGTRALAGRRRASAAGWLRRSVGRRLAPERPRRSAAASRRRGASRRDRGPGASRRRRPRRSTDPRRRRRPERRVQRRAAPDGGGGGCGTPRPAARGHRS